MLVRGTEFEDFISNFTGNEIDMLCKTMMHNKFGSTSTPSKFYQLENLLSCLKKRCTPNLVPFQPVEAKLLE